MEYNSKISRTKDENSILIPIDINNFDLGTDKMIDTVFTSIFVEDFVFISKLFY
jgi:hypothetical protein